MMKRKFESIDNYQQPLKKRKIDKKENIVSFFLEQLEKQDIKLNSILEKINNIDNRLKNVEKVIEDNSQPKLPQNNYSYFY